MHTNNTFATSKNDMHRIVFLIIMLAFVLVDKDSFSTKTEQVNFYSWKGIASFYHNKFNGRLTATGEVFNNSKLTAANNFLKLGTMVKVINPSNGKCVIVKINDRMNKNNKRLIDLTSAAAHKIGLIEKGIGEVVLEVIHP